MDFNQLYFYKGFRDLIDATISHSKCYYVMF